MDKLTNLPRITLLETRVTDRETFGYRMGFFTLLVPREGLPDSDRLTVEDSAGHRYRRDIDLEVMVDSHEGDEPYYVFIMY